MPQLYGTASFSSGITKTQRRISSAPAQYPPDSLSFIIKYGGKRAGARRPGHHRRTEKILPVFQGNVSGPHHLCLHAKHPLAASRSLTTEQLTGSFIACTPRQIPDSVFALQNNLLINLPPEQRYITESIESAIALVKAQIGYTLYPDLLPARDPELCYIPVTDLPEIPFGVYYAFGQEHPALKRFLSLMEDYLHQPRFTP